MVCELSPDGMSVVHALTGSPCERTATTFTVAEAGAGAVDPSRSPLDLFTDFYKDMTGTDLDDEDRTIVAAAVRSAIATQKEEVH